MEGREGRGVVGSTGSCGVVGEDCEAGNGVSGVLEGEEYWEMGSRGGSISSLDGAVNQY